MKPDRLVALAATNAKQQGWSVSQVLDNDLRSARTRLASLLERWPALTKQIEDAPTPAATKAVGRDAKALAFEIAKCRATIAAVERHQNGEAIGAAALNNDLEPWGVAGEVKPAVW